MLEVFSKRISLNILFHEPSSSTSLCECNGVLWPLQFFYVLEYTLAKGQYQLETQSPAILSSMSYLYEQHLRWRTWKHLIKQCFISLLKQKSNIQYKNLVSSPLTTTSTKYFWTALLSWKHYYKENCSVCNPQFHNIHLM